MVFFVKLILPAFYFQGFFNKFDSLKRLFFTANVIILFSLIQFFYVSSREVSDIGMRSQTNILI